MLGLLGPVFFISENMIGIIIMRLWNSHWLTVNGVFPRNEFDLPFLKGVQADSFLL